MVSAHNCAWRSAPERTVLRLRDACIGDEVRRMRIRRRIRIRGGEEGVVQGEEREGQKQEGLFKSKAVNKVDVG